MTFLEILETPAGIVSSIMIMGGFLMAIWKALKTWFSKWFVGDLKTKQQAQIDRNTKDIQDIKKFQGTCSRGVVKELEKYFSGEFAQIRKRLDESDKKSEEDRERDKLTLKAITASLRAHKANGANGTVSGTLSEVEDYLVDKASH